MTARERRRRLPPPSLFSNYIFLFPSLNSIIIDAGKVKIAFGNDDDDDEDNNGRQNGQETLEENNSPSLNQFVDKNNGTINSGSLYERAFFTIHNITVEVILENETLSWTHLIGESMLI